MLEDKHIIILILTISLALIVAFFALTTMGDHSIVKPEINATPVNSSENTTPVYVKTDKSADNEDTEDLTDDSDYDYDTYDDSDYDTYDDSDYDYDTYDDSYDYEEDY